jgi:hypothetical protein
VLLPARQSTTRAKHTLSLNILFILWQRHVTALAHTPSDSRLAIRFVKLCLANHHSLSFQEFHKLIQTSHSKINSKNFILLSDFCIN